MPLSLVPSSRGPSKPSIGKNIKLYLSYSPELRMNCFPEIEKVRQGISIAVFAILLATPIGNLQNLHVQGEHRGEIYPFSSRKLELAEDHEDYTNGSKDRLPQYIKVIK